MKFRHVKKEIHGHFVFLWDDIRRNLILTNGLGRYRYNFDLICQNDMILSTENIRQVMRDNFEVDFKGLQ